MNTPDRKKGSGPPAAGRPARLHPSAAARLGEGLGRGSRALPFAEAVALQLAHPPGGGGSPERERDAVRRVLALLDADSVEAARLASDPELLASVFQNIDLLYAHAFAGADAVSLLVMRAVEAAEGSP